MGMVSGWTWLTSYRCPFGNWSENVIIVANLDIAAQYLQEFERRWAEATQPDPEDLACDWEVGE
jgi:hypothetical protein